MKVGYAAGDCVLPYSNPSLTHPWVCKLGSVKWSIWSPPSCGVTLLWTLPPKRVCPLQSFWLLFFIVFGVHVWRILHLALELYFVFIPFDWSFPFYAIVGQPAACICRLFIPGGGCHVWTAVAVSAAYSTLNMGNRCGENIALCSTPVSGCQLNFFRA